MRCGVTLVSRFGGVVSGGKLAWEQLEAISSEAEEALTACMGGVLG